MTEPALTMAEFLTAVSRHGTDAREALIDQGVHPSVIYAKAEKASGKGYTVCGVHPDRCWLTEKGRTYLDLTAPDQT